jgi:hypothetical protein
LNKSIAYSASLSIRKSGAAEVSVGHSHERKDANRNVGLGPEHDWSSHSADAFGYLALSYEEPPASNSSGVNRRRSTEPPKGSFWSA